jgi:hypothetical protein
VVPVQVAGEQMNTDDGINDDSDELWNSQDGELKKYLKEFYEELATL